jgi:hypothetical protein
MQGLPHSFHVPPADSHETFDMPGGFGCIRKSAAAIARTIMAAAART